MFGNKKFKKSILTYGLIILFVFITSIVFFTLNSFVFAQGTENSSQQLSNESEQIVIKDIDIKKYPEINIEYYFCDTGKELKETYDLIEELESYLGKKIEKLKAALGSHKKPFDHFLSSESNRPCLV